MAHSCTPTPRFDNIFWTLTIVIGDTPRGSHHYAAGTPTYSLQPTAVIEDFGWQSTHLIVPLKHSVLYFEKIGEPGDEASISSTVCLLLSSSKPTNVGT